jgi:hypothetical protein
MLRLNGARANLKVLIRLHVFGAYCDEGLACARAKARACAQGHRASDPTVGRRDGKDNIGEKTGGEKNSLSVCRLV